MLNTLREEALRKHDIIFEDALLSTCNAVLGKLFKNADQDLKQLILNVRDEYVRSSVLFSTIGHTFKPHRVNLQRERCMMSMSLINRIFFGNNESSRKEIFVKAVCSLNPHLNKDLLQECALKKTLSILEFLILSSPECAQVLKADPKPEQRVQELLNDFTNPKKAKMTYEHYFNLIMEAEDLKKGFIPKA